MPSLLPAGWAIPHAPHLFSQAETVATIRCSGVTLHLDRANDDSYLEVTGEPEPVILREMECLLKALGFMALPESECLSEEFEDEVFRTWLVDMPIGSPAATAGGELQVAS